MVQIWVWTPKFNYMPFLSFSDKRQNNIGSYGDDSGLEIIESSDMGNSYEGENYINVAFLVTKTCDMGDFTNLTRDMESPDHEPHRWLMAVSREAPHFDGEANGTR